MATGETMAARETEGREFIDGRMRMRERSQILIALAVMAAFVAYFLWREYTIAGVFGFPLDDAWIHAQFARNLALGHGFSYNPGVPVSGSTAPLWTLLTATGYLVGGDSVLAAKVLGILFLGLSVYFSYVLVRAISGDAREALFSAVLVASLPRLVWASLSGMEVTLAVMLSLVGIMAHVLYTTPGDRRQYIATLAFGLATLARPECAVFFVAALLDRVLASLFIKWRELATRDWIGPVAAHIGLFLLVVMPFLVFSKRFGLGFLPNTVYAKACQWNAGLIAATASGSMTEFVRSFTVRPFDYYMSFLHESLNNNPLLFVFAGFGMLRMVFSLPYDEGSRYRSFLIPIAVVLFPVAIGVFVPFGSAEYQEGRYIAPVAPLMLIMGTVGMYGAATYAARIFSEAKFMGRPARIVLERALIWFFMIIALFAQFRSGWYRGRIYGREVANIEEMQVSIGKWVERHTPRDAVIAANDIGAIAYFSDREVLDTCGLISPEALHYLRPGERRDQAVLNFLEDVRPDYAVLFPNWYPELVNHRAIFVPAHRVVLTDNVICGGSVMVVYRLDWDALNSGEEKIKREEAARLAGEAEAVEAEAGKLEAWESDVVEVER